MKHKLNQERKKKYQSPQICRWYHPNGRKRRGTKESFFIKVKEESEKLASNSTFKKRTSWHPVPSLNANRWRTEKTVTGFIFLGSRITADSDCSHEIKQHLLFGRIAMTNLDSVLTSRDITLPKKVHIFKVIVYPVVTCECESWTIKKAEHWRIDAFELLYWRRFLRIPQTERRSKQSILKDSTLNIHWKD